MTDFTVKLENEALMFLRDVAAILDAEVLSGDNHLDNTAVAKITASDLMSSVLAFAEPGALLITGLVNVQVINTAEVAGLSGVIFVQGVRPHESVIKKAEAASLPTLLTSHSMYRTCGLLFGKGVPGA
ncbi:MAG: DRTGG domain-containing protein [Pseudomonadota bacterium]